MELSINKIMKNKKLLQQIISMLLCFVILFTSIELTNLVKKPILGATGNMTYGYSDNSRVPDRYEGRVYNFNIRSTSIMTTFDDLGYQTILKVGSNTTQVSGDNSGNATLDGVSLSTSFKSISDNNYISVIFTVKNTSNVTKTIGIAVHSDVQIGQNDHAPIYNLSNDRGFYMTDGTNSFNVLLKDAYGTTNVDTYWYGDYNVRTNYTWSNGTESSTTHYDLTSGVDSAMAFSWKDRTIAPGETQTYSVSIGVGELNNIPTISLTNTLASAYYEGQKVDIQGNVSDLDPLDTVTVKYTVDNGTENAFVTNVATNGSSKTFSGSFQIPSGFKEGNHTLMIWAVDNHGNMSPAISKTFYYKAEWLDSSVDLTANSNKGSLTIDWSAYEGSNLVYYGYRSINNASYVKSQAFNKNTYTDNSANDINAPTVSKITNSVANDKVTINFNASDNGTNYKYYIEVYQSNSLIATSNTISETITSGIAGYYYVIDNKATNDFNISTATYTTNPSITVDRNNYRYIHIRAIDKAGNVSAAANFEIPYKLTITYDYTTNGGTSLSINSNVVEVTQNSVIDLTVSAAKNGDTGIYSDLNTDGWKFVGWNTNPNATTGLSSYTIGTSNQTLFAIFSKTITITQIDGTGTRTITQTVYNNTDDYTFTTDSIRAYSGWTIRGWTEDTAPDASILVSSGAQYTFSENATLYALYSKTVTATFVDINGVTQTTRTASGTRYVNASNMSNVKNPSVTFPTGNTFTGWTWKGWSSADNKQNNASITYINGATLSLTKSATYYGLYNRIVTLTYNSEYDLAVPEKTTFTQTVNANDKDNVTYTKIIIGSAVTKTGFTFLGWGENSVSGTKYSAGSEYILVSNTSMHAVFKRNSYKVTYDYETNGGTSSEKIEATVLFEGALDLNVKAEKDGDTGVYSDSNKDGWKFVGWNTNPNATVGLSSKEMPAEDVTLYAIFSKTITITETDKTGSRTLVATVYNNTTDYTFTTDVVRDYSGWTTRGWTNLTAPDAEILVASGAQYTFSEDTKLYALYSKTVTATFVDMTGATKTQSTQSGIRYVNAYSMSTFKNPSITFPTGHTYTGWTWEGWSAKGKTDMDAPVTYANGQTIQISTNSTFYGLYSRTITLSYDMQGANESYAKETFKQLTNAYDSSVRTGHYTEFEEAPTKKGHTFKGWAVNSLDGEMYNPFDTNYIFADTTYYAVFERNSYKVIYNFTQNGGTASDKTEAMVLFEGAVDLTVKATKDGDTGIFNATNNPDGWKFIGWSTNPNATTPITSLTMDIEQITLYAIFEKTITVTQIDNEGTRVLTKTLYNNTASHTFKTDSIRAYSDFTIRGWGVDKIPNASIAVASGADVTLNADTTYYALYSKTVTATFVDITGSTQTSSTKNGTRYVNAFDMTSIKNPTITAPSGNTYTGWTWKGWSSANTTTNNASVAYQNGATITLTKDVTFYGLYNRVITLTYDSEGGDSTPSEVTFTQEINAYDKGNITKKELILASSVTRTGFKFIGWGENSVSGTKYNAQDKYILSATTSMHAIWERLSYKVTYNYSTNGGTSVEKQSIDTPFESQIDLTVNAIKDGDTGVYASDNRDGWKFVGWNTDPNATVGLSSMEMPAEDVTLYAIFSKDISIILYDISGTTKQTVVHKFTVYNNTTKASHTPEAIDTLSYDPTGGTWNAVGYATGALSSSSVKYNVGTSYDFSRDTTLYAIYSRELSVDFVSYDETTSKTQTVFSTQYTNANDYAQPTSPTFTAPSIYTYTGDLVNGAWTKLGWLNNTVVQTTSLTPEGGSVSHNKKQTYYAIYSRDITVTYVDYLNTTRKETTVSHPQVTSSSNILNYTNPTVTLKDINSYTGWTKYSWTTDPNGVNNMYNEGHKYKLTGNITFYAIYKRDVNVKFVFADKEDVTTKTQYANSSDIENTKQTLTFTMLQIPSYEQNGYTFNGLYWNTSTSNNLSSGLEAYKTVSTKEDLTYYAYYYTTFDASFISINGSMQKTNTISQLAYMNAYDVTSIKNPSITVPSLYTNRYNSFTWKPVGYSKDTLATSTVTLHAGDTITLTGHVTYYGIYDSTVTATFIDYVENSKRTQTVDVGQKLNSFDFDIKATQGTSPQIGIYKDNSGNDWIIRGWTTASEAAASISFESGKPFNITENTTFYAVYEQKVVLTLIDYKGNDKNTTTLTNSAYLNSNNVSNIQMAQFNIPLQNNCTLDSKHWNNRGWASLASATLPTYLGDTQIELSSNQTLYGLYNTTITLTYDGNGGSTTEEEILNKIINASGYEKNPSVIITSYKPVRKGYKFQNMWRNNTNKGDEYLPGNTYTLTNDLTLYAQWGIETVNKTVTVNFNDNSDVLSSRPDNVYITLYRDGEKTTSYIVSTIDNTICYPQTNKTIDANGQKITVTKTANGFSYTFEGLQKFSESDGHEYRYTVTQNPFDSKNSDVAYSQSYSPDTFTITNNLVNSNKKVFSGKVIWVDDSNAWFLRPETITLTLIRTNPDDAKDVVAITKTLLSGSANSLDYEFSNLEAINSKLNPYKYEIVQSEIPLYDITLNGTVFTNTLNSLPGGFTGGAGNKLTITADAFDFNGNVADKEDYLAISATEDEAVLITLKQIKKTWSGTGASATEKFNNNVYATDTETGKVISYNVIVTPNKDTVVDYLPDGRYEIVVASDSSFDFNKFKASSAELENATLIEENGRFFITYESKYEFSAIIKLHAEILLDSWRGYTSTKELYKLKDYTIIK